MAKVIDDIDLEGFSCLGLGYLSYSFCSWEESFYPSGIFSFKLHEYIYILMYTICNLE